VSLSRRVRGRPRRRNVEKRHQPTVVRATRRIDAGRTENTRVWNANVELVRKGLVLMTWGNASAIDRAKRSSSSSERRAL